MKQLNFTKRLEGCERSILDLSQRVGGCEKSIVDLTQELRAFKGETALNFLRVDQKLQEVAEKVTIIPKMYDMLDTFITELKTSRQEQTLLSHKVSNHEARIAKLEKSKA